MDKKWLWVHRVWSSGIEIIVRKTCVNYSDTSGLNPGLSKTFAVKAQFLIAVGG